MKFIKDDSFNTIEALDLKGGRIVIEFQEQIRYIYYKGDGFVRKLQKTYVSKMGDDQSSRH